MKCITLQQPASSMAALGIITIISRFPQKAPLPRGAIGSYVAIHAGKKLPHRGIMEGAFRIFPELKERAVRIHGTVWTLPHSVVLAVARVVDVRLLDRPEDYMATKAAVEAGMWGFVLEDVVELEEPVPCSRGQRKLWELPMEVELGVREMMKP